MSLNPLWHLTLSRLRELSREPGTMFWAFGFPILLSVGLGIAFRNNAEVTLPAAVVQSSISEQLLATLSAAGVPAIALDAAQAHQRLREGRVSLVVSADGAAPRSGVTYQFDPSRVSSRLARELVDRALQADRGRQDPLAVRDEPVTDRTARYIDFLVPGLVGMNVMSGSMWAVGWAIVSLRTRKLLKRLLATPLPRWQLLGSFALARLLLLPFEIVSLLVFARLTFHVPLPSAGAAVLLGLVSLLGCLSFSGLAVCVASRAQNVETVTGLMNAVMIPMFVLSGVFFPASRFPELLQPALTLLPLTALNDALRAVILDRSGLREIVRPVLILFGWGATAAAAGLRAFRWS